MLAATHLKRRNASRARDDDVEEKDGRFRVQSFWVVLRRPPLRMDAGPPLPSRNKNKSSTRRPRRTEEAKKRGRLRKSVCEPLRFMSGIWDRSFDEYDENDEDRVAEGEEEKVASHVKKQFGYFGFDIANILRADLLLVVIFGALRVVVERWKSAVVSYIFAGDVFLHFVLIVRRACVDFEDSTQNDVYFSSDIGGEAGVFVASFCSTAMSIIPLYIGFAGLFGIACGLGYGLSQQMSSFAPFGQGLGTGLVTWLETVARWPYAPLIEKKLDFYGPDVALRNLSYAIAVFGTVASLCFHKASIDIPLGLRRRNKLAVTDLETLRRLTDLRPLTRSRCGL